MIFHHRQKRDIPKLNLYLNGKQIEQVTIFDFLGLTLTSTLDWSRHISKVSNKISQTIGIMSRIKRYVPRSALKQIYDSLILSRLHYSILVWGFDSARLMTLQKRAIRTICGAKYNAHTDPLFQDLGLVKIKDIFEIQCCKLYYKFKHKLLPVYFQNFFQTNQDIHSHNTRQSRDLRNVRRNFKTTSKCIRFHIPSLINNLPILIREKIDSHSLDGFSNYMKRHILRNYERECHKNKCFTCGKL